MSDYNVVFASDINYLPYTLVAVQSVVDSLNTGRTSVTGAHTGYGNVHGCHDRIIFHILVDDSVNIDDFRQRCNDFVRRNSKAAASLDFNIISVDKSIFTGYRPWGPHQSYSAYYRLLIDRLIPDSVSCVLYLDVDVLVLGDIREMFDSTNLDGKVLAAVNEIPFYLRGIDWSLKARDTSCPDIVFDNRRYFNSGVLLINLNKWREVQLGDHFISFFDQYDAQYPDQDALNHLCGSSDVAYLDPSWNVQAATYELAMNTDHEFRDLYRACDIYSSTSGFAGHDGAEYLRNPRIVHMTQIKPWATEGVFFRGDRPALLAPDHIKFLGQWRDTAMRVTEYGEETWAGSAQIQEIFAAGILNLHNRLIEEKSRRRKDRITLITVFSVLSLLSMVMSACALFLR